MKYQILSLQNVRVRNRLVSGQCSLDSQTVESFLPVCLEEKEEKSSNPECYSQNHQHDDVKLKIVLGGRKLCIKLRIFVVNYLQC